MESPRTDIMEKLHDISLTCSIFKADGFVDFLMRNSIPKLYFCGIDLDACVLASAFDAFGLGYDFEVLFGLTETNATIEKNHIMDVFKRNLLSKSKIKNSNK